MGELGRVVAQALHTTRDGGTAVLSDPDGAVVQWICFGSDGHTIEVPDPDRHRPGRLRRLLGRTQPSLPGLGEERTRCLERLGFTAGEHGPERPVGPGELGHDQLVQLVVDALEIVGIDADRVSVETF